MNFPETPSITRSKIVVDAMIVDLADQERDTHDAYHGRRYHETLEVSRTVGQLCLAVVDGGPMPETSKRDGQYVLQTMQTMINERATSKRLMRRQRQMHYAAMDELKASLEYSGVGRWGSVAETVTLGLLTRYAHPSLLAYKSLPHHERSADVAGHYDVGVVIKEPRGLVSTHNLQVKCVCIGSCQTPDSNSEITDYYFSKYRPSVQLVSGCCHLGIGSPKQQDEQIPQLLVKELEGSASAKEIKKLDVITDSLIFTMSSDLLPRGNAGGGSIALPAEFYMQLRNVE